MWTVARPKERYHPRKRALICLFQVSSRAEWRSAMACPTKSAFDLAPVVGALRGTQHRNDDSRLADVPDLPTDESAGSERWSWCSRIISSIVLLGPRLAATTRQGAGFPAARPDRSRRGVREIRIPAPPARIRARLRPSAPHLPRVRPIEPSRNKAGRRALHTSALVAPKLFCASTTTPCRTSPAGTTSLARRPQRARVNPHR